MSLFDYMRCEMPLPPDEEGVECTIKVFQTKFFDEPYMHAYTITEDGRLICDEGRDEGEREVKDFHGDLDFSDWEKGEAWRFVARFTDGRCTRIRCASHTISL